MHRLHVLTPEFLPTTFRLIWLRRVQQQLYRYNRQHIHSSNSGNYVIFSVCIIHRRIDIRKSAGPQITMAIICLYVRYAGPAISRFDMHIKCDPVTFFPLCLHRRPPSGIPPPCRPGNPPNPGGMFMFGGMGNPWEASCFCNCARSIFIGGALPIPGIMGNPGIGWFGGGRDCGGGG